MRRRLAAGILFAALLLAELSALFDPVQAQPAATRAGTIRACDAGVMYECGRAGSLMMEGTDGPKNPAAARQYYERACTGEVAIACQSIAVSLVHGFFGGAADVRGSLPYYAKACQLGAAEACTQDGLVAHQLGDFTRSRAASVKGCQAGSAAGCRSSAYLLREGKGGPADRLMAAAYYNQACRMNDQGGCQNLAVMRNQGVLPASLPVIRIAPSTPNEGRRPAVASAAPPVAPARNASHQQFIRLIEHNTYKVQIATSSVNLATKATARREKCAWLRDAQLNLQEAQRAAEAAHSLAVRENYEAFYVTQAQEMIDRGNRHIATSISEQRNLC